jgi:hypothetical protein
VAIQGDVEYLQAAGDGGHVEIGEREGVAGKQELLTVEVWLEHRLEDPVNAGMPGLDPGAIDLFLGRRPSRMIATTGGSSSVIAHNVHCWTLAP